MEVTRAGAAFLGWLFATALTLSGCGGAAEDARPPVAVDREAAIDPANYAGDVMFRIVETLPAQDEDVPFKIYLGLVPETETRLRANAIVDLRELQLALPKLLTGRVDPNCNLRLDVEFHGAEAEGDTLRAQATVMAALYHCRSRGTEDERRGWRLLTQTINVDAVVSGGLDGRCIAFRLDDLELAPRNVFGRLATLVGMTERVRVAILEEASTTLAENPVCPDLPPALDSLDPRFRTFGVREIGTGGIGAVLSGSAQLDAENLLALLALAAERAAASGEKARLVAAEAARVDMRLEDSFEARGSDVLYSVDVRLTAVAPTRIGVQTTLDLSDFQSRLPDLIAEEVLVDTCGGRATLQRLEAEAQEASVIARGELELERFDCERTGPGSWQRGERLAAEEVSVRAEMSGELVEGCVVLRLHDLRRDPPGALAQLATGSGRTEAARALLFEAVELVLEDHPICPELPPEVEILDPRFDRGQPEEIGAGGVGVALDGSIDVSPGTLVELLRMLQERGVVPPPP